jgi:hypothetical protein
MFPLEYPFTVLCCIMTFQLESIGLPIHGAPPSQFLYIYMRVRIIEVDGVLETSYVFMMGH